MCAIQRNRMIRGSRVSFRLLEEAAMRDDRQDFTRLAREIQWKTALAEDLSRAIDLALALELVPLAMELAQRGKQLFPNSQRIQRAAQVLKPPVIVSTRPAQGDSRDVSRAWLTQHDHEYRGQWVAVRGGALLGASPTLNGLYQQIGSAADMFDTIVVKVLP